MPEEQKGQSLAKTQERRAEPASRWERGTVLGPDMGLGRGLGAREKVDVPIAVPEDMEPGQRSEYLWDLCALPQPVVLVTTADLQGNVNCAPKNWVSWAGSHGFLFCCSTEHDTYMNAQTTREFVVNIPGADLVDRLHALARRGAASWENELRRAGLGMVPSKEVRPPRVRECRVHLECRVQGIHALNAFDDVGTDKAGRDVLVVGRIVAAAADAEILQAPTYEDRLRALRPFVLAPIWSYHVVEEAKPLPEQWDLEY